MPSQVYSFYMDNNFNKESIKKLRKAQGLSQVEFARMLDVDSITISRWERGQTKPMPVHKRKMLRLARKVAK